MSPTECLLKAENYAVAARMAPEGERMGLLEQAVVWHKRAFEMRMLRFEHLREIQDEDEAAPVFPPARLAD
jgi:hypothetical protein